MPWRYQICLARCLFSCADDLSEDMGMFAAQECKTSSSCWRAFPQKRPCLSSVARSKTEKSRINLLLPWRHGNSGALLSWNPADLCSSKLQKWLTRAWVFVVYRIESLANRVKHEDEKGCFVCFVFDCLESLWTGSLFWERVKKSRGQERDLLLSQPLIIFRGGPMYSWSRRRNFARWHGEDAF